MGLCRSCNQFIPEVCKVPSSTWSSTINKSLKGPFTFSLGEVCRSQCCSSSVLSDWPCLVVLKDVNIELYLNNKWAILDKVY